MSFEEMHVHVVIEATTIITSPSLLIVFTILQMKTTSLDCKGCQIRDNNLLFWSCR
jgi:hypothetical protein